MFYAALSGMLYGSLGYFGMKILQQEQTTVSAMLFWRFFATSILFLVLLLPSLRALQFNFKEAFYAFSGGALFYVGSAAFYFFAVEYIGIGLSMVLFFTYPVMVSILNWLFHSHKATLYDYISFLCIIVGSILLVDLANITFDMYGIGLSLLGALSYALYMVFSKRQIKSLGPLLSSFLVSAGSTVLFFLLTQWEGSFFISTEAITWVNIVGIGLISTALPMLLLLLALKHIGSTKASIVSVLEPVISVFVGILAFGETVTFLQGIGVVAILSGALIIQFDRPVGNN